jgi:hypothetical protein
VIGSPVPARSCSESGSMPESCRKQKEMSDTAVINGLEAALLHRGDGAAHGAGPRCTLHVRMFLVVRTRRCSTRPPSSRVCQCADCWTL